MPIRPDSELLPSALEVIGGTPLVALSRLFDESEGRVLAKLEYLNPGGSKKDRVARQIIEDGTREGRLAPHQTVVELTSGNTGTSLAIVCALTHHPFVAVMSRGLAPERVGMMEALGAEVELVDQAPGSAPGTVTAADLELLEEAVDRVVSERGAFLADQFENVSNFRAHRLYTGPEILSQTGGKFGAFCDFVGSGGTFAGCVAAFKEYQPSIRCYVVEPEGAAFLAHGEGSGAGHRIQGGGYGRDLPMLDPSRIDGFVQVSEQEAIGATRDLARSEGLFAGLSSGANVAAARKLLAGSRHGETIVIVLGDSGMKYLSSGLWTRRGDALSSAR